jgi:hypothetical protein
MTSSPRRSAASGRGLSCTTALTTALAAWVLANKSKVVAVIGFDLSAAFDTVDREDLLPKMSAIGIRGKALKWFRCYLTNAKHRIIWDGHMSDIVDAEYGVCQVSLLGPVLYLLHVLHLPFGLEIRESNGNSAYANDTALWVIADDVEESQQELQRLADAMSDFTKDNGLALNRAKTQVMIARRQGQGRLEGRHCCGRRRGQVGQHIRAAGGHIVQEVHSEAVPGQPLEGG